MPKHAHAPSVSELATATAVLLRVGPQASRIMRQTLSARYGLEPEAADWPRFVNNHAWALVKLQADGIIHKLGPGVYELSSPIIPPMQREVPTPEIRDNAILPPWATRMVSTARRKNALRWNSETFTEADLRQLWQRCGGHCAMTGLPFFETQIGTGAARKPYAPSLDRIDPEQPYVRENCRLVRVCVNFALNAFGDDVFLEMAEAAVTYQRERS
jgi:hypothetical protein